MQKNSASVLIQKTYKEEEEALEMLSTRNVAKLGQTIVTHKNDIGKSRFKALQSHENIVLLVTANYIIMRRLVWK